MSRVIKAQDQTKAVFSLEKVDGLVVSIMGGNIDAKNVATAVPGAKLTLTASATNYVYVDWGSEELKATVTLPQSKDRPLWEFDTDLTTVVATRDRRSTMRHSAHTEFKTRDAYLLNTVFNVNQDWTDLDLSVPAPRGATGVLLGLQVMDSGTPGSTVWFRIRKPGETDLTRAITLYPQVSGLYVFGFAPMGMDAKKIQYKANISGAMTVKLALMGWIYGG